MFVNNPFGMRQVYNFLNNFTFRLTLLQASVLRKHAMPRFSIIECSIEYFSLHQCLMCFIYTHYHFFKVIPTKDRIEALMAFREKRKPVFKGE